MRIHEFALGLTVVITGCSSSDAPTIDISLPEHQTQPPFTEQDILADLDECGGNAPYKFFLDLDHRYVYTASSHITLFADKQRWAIVMEKTGFNPRGGNVPLELNFFGNCLQGLDKAGSDGQFTCNTKFLELIQGDEMERINTGVELVRRSADSITIRDQRVPLDQDNAQYEAIGIETRFTHNPDKLLSLEGLVRYLSEKHPALFRANDREFRTCLSGDLPRLMTIDRWVHPKDLGLGDGPGPRPSTYETFQTIAKILVTRDTSLWKEPAAPNNDWRFHPDAGSL
jgi:hypothetical protein